MPRISIWKNSPEFSCVGGMLLSQNTSLFLAWEIVHSYLLPPTPENFKKFILITWIISKSLVHLPKNLCFSNNRIWVIWFDSTDFLWETVLPILLYVCSHEFKNGSIYRWKQAILVLNFSLISVSSQCFLKSHHLTIILSALSWPNLGNQ